MAKEIVPVGTSETPELEEEKKQVKSWLRTIASTEKWNDGIHQKRGTKRFIDEYKGKWDFLESSVSIPIIPINLVYAFVKTDVARMSYRDPWITVNPKRVEDIGAAQIAEQVLNYTWRDLRMKSQIKQGVTEADLAGYSWIKVGYAAEFGTVESRPKQRSPGRPAKVSEVETNEYIRSENVFAYYVPYKDVIWDPSATFPATDNARWMAHRVVKPYRAVKGSGIYKHVDDIRVSAEPSDPMNPFESQDANQEAFGKDVRSVVLWEIYDLDHKTITTISPGCAFKLREVPLPDYLNGSFPFVMISYTPVPGEAHPLSEVAPHEGQIIELTKLLSIELNHLKRWNRMLLMVEGCMTESEESKFKDAQDGAIIKVQPVAGKALGDNILPVPYAPIQSDIYGVWNQIFQIWQQIAGQTSPDQGGQARTQTRTLGELQLSIEGGHARSDEKLDVLEDCIAEVARKMLNIMQKKFDLPKLARIVGDKAVREKILKILPGRPSAQPQMPGQGQEGDANPVASQSYTGDFGFSWNKTDIFGEMDVDVLAGSTIPLDRQAQIKIMESIFPFLEAVGIEPGSPASKAFAREYMRLTGLLSLDTVMDIADQTPPAPDPKMAETQMKMQTKAAETQMKMQAKTADAQMKLQSKEQESQIKLEAMKQEAMLKEQGMAQDISMKQAMNQMDMQKKVMEQILYHNRLQHEEEVSQNGGSSNGKHQN